jgi:hypothetical protein
MALEMKYFVLKPASKWADDPYAAASRAAMRAYAEAIGYEDPKLADALEDWAAQEASHNTRLCKELHIRQMNGET